MINTNDIYGVKFELRLNKLVYFKNMLNSN